MYILVYKEYYDNKVEDLIIKYLSDYYNILIVDVESREFNSKIRCIESGYNACDKDCCHSFNSPDDSLCLLLYLEFYIRYYNVKLLSSDSYKDYCRLLTDFRYINYSYMLTYNKYLSELRIEDNKIIERDIIDKSNMINEIIKLDENRIYIDESYIDKHEKFYYNIKYKNKYIKETELFKNIRWYKTYMKERLKPDDNIKYLYKIYGPSLFKDN